jgi:DNA-binding response OmpR family regulator
VLIPLAEAATIESERRASDARRLVIDRDAHRVWADGRPVHLTAKEFALLCLLADRPGAVLTRQKLLESVWGSRYLGGPRTVDVHVRRLRRKLGGALSLDTVRGVGYRYGSERGEPLWTIASEIAASQTA